HRETAPVLAGSRGDAKKKGCGDAAALSWKGLSFACADLLYPRSRSRRAETRQTLPVSFGRLSSSRVKTANGDEGSNLSRFDPGCDQRKHGRYGAIALPGNAISSRERAS